MLKKYVFMSLAMTAASAVLSQDYLPILQYHHVDTKTPRSTSVTPAEFQAHMDYLSQAGFKVVDLAQSIAAIKAGQPLPDKAVAITFDDAYRNIYENGFPILKSHGYPFTVFINTGPVEKQHSSFLSWQQMQEMQQQGGVFANHTVNHPYMLQLEKDENKAAWRSRMEQEVMNVEGALVQHLGATPKMLAYPYGESNQALRQQMADLGLVAFGQQSGVVGPMSDFTNLPRFPAAGSYADLASLKDKLNAKPMPLAKSVETSDYAGAAPVSMTLTFAPGDYRLKQLSCFVSGQGRAQLAWRDERTVSVHTNQAFPEGRGRVNCTMPDASGQRFYWFSNVWIRPGKDQHYVTD